MFSDEDKNDGNSLKRYSELTLIPPVILEFPRNQTIPFPEGTTIVTKKGYSVTEDEEDTSWYLWIPAAKTLQFPQGTTIRRKANPFGITLYEEDAIKFSKSVKYALNKTRFTSSKGIRTVGFEFVDTDFQHERKGLGNLVSGLIVNPVGALKDWNRLMCLASALLMISLREGIPHSAFPTVRPDRPDLNLEEQVFSHCTQRQKKRVGVKDGCGEKDRYDAAQMVRFTHADSNGNDLDEEDIEGDEEDCDDDPKKVGRKTPSRGTRCEWRVRCQYNKKSDEYKITTLNLTHTCPGHLHKWRGPTSKAPWLAQVFGDRITSEYRRPVGQLQTEFRR
ncbi:hypothetical protein R1sor_011750 [Riccia sorocarpa]|uniref:Uncharacterized protein n=1 Tax=Riccia sorocarpa TaxID=122646 RepID=A0ABD3I3P1_9MARC